MRHVVALSVFVLVVAAVLATGSCGRIGLESLAAPDVRANYIVQEIDGCEYIVYKVFPESKMSLQQVRMIHSASCENHGLARELKEQF